MFFLRSSSRFHWKISKKLQPLHPLFASVIFSPVFLFFLTFKENFRSWNACAHSLDFIVYWLRMWNILYFFLFVSRCNSKLEKWFKIWQELELSERIEDAVWRFNIKSTLKSVFIIIFIILFPRSKAGLGFNWWHFLAFSVRPFSNMRQNPVLQKPEKQDCGFRLEKIKPGKISKYFLYFTVTTDF